jgi:hypothetical protein
VRVSADFQKAGKEPNIPMIMGDDIGEFNQSFTVDQIIEKTQRSLERARSR